MASSIHQNQPDQHGLSSFSTFFIICSVLIYVICHTFNVSPSILLQTTKFWFFVSNALILFIAIDSGIFSSSSSYDPDDHDQLAVLIPAIPTFEQGTFQEQEEAASKSSSGSAVIEQENIEKDTKNQDAIEFKSLSIVITQIDEQQVHEKRVINEESPSLTISNIKHDDEAALEIINWSSELDLKERSCGRSNSERITRATITHDDDQDKNVIHRSRTEPADSKRNYEEIDDDQFSNMTNDELNRRVEEFISKFKKQQFRLEGSDKESKRNKKS